MSPEKPYAQRWRDPKNDKIRHELVHGLLEPASDITQNCY